MIKSYKDLEIWQESKEIVKKVYKITTQLPKEEIYGLTSQLRRAAISIASNIAEGHQRQHKKEFRQFLYHALGSLAELETQLEIVSDIYQIQISERILEQIDLLGKKIRKLIKKLDANDQRQATSDE
jgi:four helix bundle protein